MTSRLDFLRSSVAAMAGFTVRDLTDGHDAWLFDRELEPHVPAILIPTRILDDSGAVLAEGITRAFQGPQGLSAEPLVLEFRNEGSRVVTVARVVRCIEMFGSVVVCDCCANLPVVLMPGDTVTVNFPAGPLVTFTSA